VNPVTPLRVRVLDWPGLIEAGLKVHTPDSVPVQERAISPVNPKALVALIVYVAESTPRGSVVVPAAVERAKDVTPVPERLITCGLPRLSVIVIPPRRISVGGGAKFTVNVQLSPAPSVMGATGQVLIWLKSPLNVMLLMVNAAAPLLVRVTVWGALVVPTPWGLKVSKSVESVTAGAVPVPVPTRLTVSTWAAAAPESSVIATSPSRVPAAVGVNVTVTVQVPVVAASVAGKGPHGVGLARAKSPPTVMPVMCSGAVPIFAIVKLLTVALVVPTN
jgi:hypothetical protein